jgi:hypothetical protein
VTTGSETLPQPSVTTGGEAVSDPGDSLSGVPHVKVKKKRPRKGLIVIILLSVALAAAVAFLAYYFIKLDNANARIEKQQQEIEHQKELIEKKETFGAAVKGLIVTASKFDGLLMTSIVPFDEYEIVVAEAWDDRRDANGLDRDTARVRSAQKDLEALLTAAQSQATTNTTATMYETVTDQLGGGFVSSLIDDADSICETDALACVVSDDPYTVHFDAADNSAPYMTDFLRTGIAYHEFAHVLQITNPAPTETTLEAFGGDEETMADCFALTYLPGWKLDHRIWTSRYEYWDVSIGYGYTCNASQKQAVRDWYGQLGFHIHPLSQ